MSPSRTVETRTSAEQLQVIEIYVRDISLEHGQAFDPRLIAVQQTFSRYSWVNGKRSILAPGKTDHRQSSKPYLLGFQLQTLTTIGLGPPISEQEEIPDEKVVGTIFLNFVIEYALSFDPSTLSSDELDVIEKTRVSGDIWPYWRENLQSLAMRARLPLPLLPPCRPLEAGAISKPHPAKKQTAAKSGSSSRRKAG